MRNAYITPAILLANGKITLTASQAAKIGIGSVAAWEDFWADAHDSVLPEYENFDINDSSTYPPGFRAGDPDSWYILIGF